jgi:Tfp pilus assembly protein PilF
MARIRSFGNLLRRHPVKILVAIVVLCVLGLGAHHVAGYWHIESQRRAAERALARYEFDEALEHYAVCLAAQPRSGPLHLQMARASRRAGKYDQAAEHLALCQQLEGRTSANGLEGTLLRTESGDVASTEQFLMQQIERGSPEATQIMEALAQGYVRTYRLGNARHWLDRLLERQPDNVRALMVRGRLRESAGDDQGAEADFRRAIEVQPDHVAARCQLGEFLLRHNRPEEALHQYEYVRTRPGGDQPAVLLGLGRSQRRLGALDAAREVLDDLLARYPQSGDALMERGKLALDRAAPAEAEVWLRKAVGNSPYNAQANYLLAQSLRRQNKDEQAKEYELAQERIERDQKLLAETNVRVGKAPADPEPRRESALICFRLGREREGLRWLLSALDQAPRDRPTHAALADYYERIGKSELADKHRREAQTP